MKVAPGPLDIDPVLHGLAEQIPAVGAARRSDNPSFHLEKQ